jgi:hypothetical protein
MMMIGFLAPASNSAACAMADGSGVARVSGITVRYDRFAVLLVENILGHG